MVITKESNVDVLIIGAGPAGYMLANWLARTGVTNVRIIDKRSTEIFTGQADGLQCRTLEIFQSFGFADRALKEANHMLEICFWEPDKDGVIHRSGRMPDTIIGISRFQQMVIHQGRIEAWFTDAIKKWSSGKLAVERPVLPETLAIDESKVDDPEAYPVSVNLRHLKKDNALPEQFGSKISNGLFRAYDDAGDYKGDANDELETVHAKYVVGTDGAHSWTRRQIGIELEGEATDYIWGVLDAVPITNFPDIRLRCSIHSQDSGSIMIIPRENGLVRLYCQLKEAPRDEGDGSATARRMDRSKITPEFILNTAKKIFAPYTLEVTDIKWYTGYQIGQRVAKQFQKSNRVFVGGDATHTHSPKAGQGMNTSMCDTFNLGWKLAHVIKGLADPSILTTYEQERRQVARDLINFDYKFSRLFSGKPKSKDSDEGVSLEEFKKFFEKGNEFASGTIVDYDGSMLINKPKGVSASNSGHEELYLNPLAKGCPIGRRFDQAQVVMQSDCRPYYLNDMMLSDGRWRVVYFAGDIKRQTKLYDFMLKFGNYLDGKDTFVKRYTPATAQLDSVIEILLVHASERVSVEWDEFPTAFRIRDHKERMNYWKIFADDDSYHEGHGHAYNNYGVDPLFGAFVVVRPDGHVADVQELTTQGIDNIDKFFSAFMLPQTPSWTSHGGYIPSTEPEPEWYGEQDYGKPLLAV
ncbi:hypothetical protein AWJ20_385 [Sugiyamaella lignohabitans]|uniref:Phenol 2-monooxygenase n=1 Tax=Sugiyamaella lignohabitans TaxID=796027 RepID=A0A161HIA0_9ASCO|nr:uncharacterized protein AWJ20_385 [Sugiyamaella lignohabitans]ANB12147.1 hypothetical protein AWJ20_385 [Sugiyamaella lignohabitans]